MLTYGKPAILLVFTQSSMLTVHWESTSSRRVLWAVARVMSRTWSRDRTRTTSTRTRTSSGVCPPSSVSAASLTRWTGATAGHGGKRTGSSRLWWRWNRLWLGCRLISCGPPWKKIIHAEVRGHIRRRRQYVYEKWIDNLQLRRTYANDRFPRHFTAWKSVQRYS